MDGDYDAAVAAATAIATTYGLAVLGAVAILVVGWMAAGWVERLVRRLLAKTARVDETLRSFLSSLARYGVLVFTGLAVLDQFGVQTASLIAVIGATGLAIGLAMQGTLSNVAAGVMLLLFRPFKSGDYIETGSVAGTVRALNLFTTELATPDNVQIIVPNGQIWGASIKNFSFHQTRRLDLTLGIGYGDDIDKAIAAVHALIAADDRAMTTPAPQVVVRDLGDSSVILAIRIWCESRNFWPLRFDLTKALKQRMDAEGITIPFPQRDVHLHRAPSAQARHA